MRNDTFKITEIINQTKSDTVIFENGEYNIFSDGAKSEYLNISNHGNPGMKNILIHLKNCENVVLDFSNSSVILHDKIVPIVISDCKNITIKNLSLETKNTYNFQGKVIEVTENYCDIQIEHSGELQLINNELYIEKTVVFNTLELENTTKEVRKNTGDQCFKDNFREIKKELLGDVLRLFNCKLYPKVNNYIVFMAAKRDVSGIFIQNSSQITLENITFYNGIGMGVIAQNCEDIDVFEFKVKPKSDKYFSLNADALHFVSCRGLIKVENSSFENQLDDALNIHGIYNKIVHISGNVITLQYMNDESLGIDIYRIGDKIAFIDSKSLLRCSEAIVKKSEHVDINHVKLTLDFVPRNVYEGMLTENISANANLIFKSNTVKNNRARGILIASIGETLIENNYFHTAGAAINLSADGHFWFESGAVSDVKIKNNTFDNCKHGEWEKAVIDIPFYDEFVENEYFHNIVMIENNEFITSGQMLLNAQNIGNLKTDIKGNINIEHCR